MSPEDRKARVARMKAAARKGVSLYTIARQEGWKTTGGAIHFLRRHAPELHKKLCTRHKSGGKPVAREEAVRRLRLGLKIEEAGLSPVALAKWLSNVAPHGCADALLDYDDDDV